LTPKYQWLTTKNIYFPLALAILCGLTAAQLMSSSQDTGELFWATQKRRGHSGVLQKVLKKRIEKKERRKRNNTPSSSSFFFFGNSGC
jgi:hypothetical protein